MDWALQGEFEISGWTQPTEEPPAEERSCAQGTEAGGNVGDVGTCVESRWRKHRIRSAEVEGIEEGTYMA